MSDRAAEDVDRAVDTAGNRAANRAGSRGDVDWVFLSFVHRYAHFDEIVGGEQVRPYELFNALADMGHDVHVYERHNHDGNARRYGRLRVRPLPLPSDRLVRRILFWPVLYAVFFLELLRARRSGARLCLYQTLPWGARDVRRLELFPAYVLFRLAGRVGATTWGALHDLPLDHLEYGRTLEEQQDVEASEHDLARRAADVQMRQVRHADFVTVVSETMRRAVVARSGVDPDRVAVFRSAVNPRQMETISEWEPPAASGRLHATREAAGRPAEATGRPAEAPTDRSSERPWRIGFLGHAADAHLPLLIDAIERLTE
ncbi:MAG: glycosyltransferase, partial [Rhodothermales bacterium]